MKITACRSVDNYEKISRIQEGSYGVVYKARDKNTNEIVALKRVKIDNNQEGFPLTSLREITILMKLNHPNIVKIVEVVVGGTGESVFMAMEYVDHDLKTILSSPKIKLTISEIKCLMIQLLEGVKYLHDHWIIHRDLKTTNLLVSSSGSLKICDFGIARSFGDVQRPLTQMVMTLWYRPPEILLGETFYNQSADMWSVGCVFAEMISREAILPGKSEIEQIQLIFNLFGVPTEQTWKGYTKLPHVQKFNFKGSHENKLRGKFGKILSDEGMRFLSGLLTMDPKKRWTAQQALGCSYFKESPYPQKQDLMRSFIIE